MAKREATPQAAGCACKGIILQGSAAPVPGTQFLAASKAASVPQSAPAVLVSLGDFRYPTPCRSGCPVLRVPWWPLKLSPMEITGPFSFPLLMRDNWTIYVTKRGLQHLQEKIRERGKKKKREKGKKNPPLKQELRSKFYRNFTDSRIFNVLSVSVLGDAGFC